VRVCFRSLDGIQSSIIIESNTMTYLEHAHSKISYIEEHNDDFFFNHIFRPKVKFHIG